MIHQADVLEAFRGMADNSFHGCLTDPPYGLADGESGKAGFLGHGWDHGVPSAYVWKKLLRVLRPGAYLLAFGGSRTFHRLTCAIEDAGFEIRDCALWMYGNGFPKNQDISKALDRSKGAERMITGTKTSKRLHITAPRTKEAKQWEGFGTALKPAWEPIIVARKPMEGTVIENIRKWGCGGLAIDASRVADVGATTLRSNEYVGALATCADPRGRWPSNILMDETAGAMLDAQTPHLVEDDGRGISRFYYCPKPTRAEKDAGLEDFELLAEGADEGEDGGGRNVHPTVKPLALAKYLARLILPPVLDARMVVPFCGSGSEVIGALQAGWAHVDGIDSWDVAVKTARARVAHWVPTRASIP